MLPLLLLVNIWFQVYFIALTGLLFTFPSRYLFTIGLEKYLDLPVSSGGFPRAFRVPGYLRTETKKIFCFRLWDYHPLGFGFPADQSNKKFDNFSDINITSLPRNPYHTATTSLVFSAFARRYWRNACLFIFHLVLKCFTSQGTLLLRFLDSEGHWQSILFIVRLIYMILLKIVGVVCVLSMYLSGTLEAWEFRRNHPLCMKLVGITLVVPSSLLTLLLIT